MIIVKYQTNVGEGGEGKRDADVDRVDAVLADFAGSDSRLSPSLMIDVEVTSR